MRGESGGGSVSFASITGSRVDGSLACAKLGALGPPRHRLPEQRNANAPTITRQGPWDDHLPPNPNLNHNLNLPRPGNEIRITIKIKIRIKGQTTETNLRCV